jgi:glucose/arabinose dehydrogenase/mono/diheme cytochrome c family protein
MQTQAIRILRYIAPAILLAATLLSCQSISTSESEIPFATPHVVNQSSITVPQSPEEAVKSFRLPKGYRLELVASEPMITEPVAIAWDGNGRMYVAQMDTYMQTIDAKAQYEPGSKIMLLEDTDDDGRMDKSSVFIDSLTAPRMILTVGHELFVNETNSYSIFAYRDTNGDGRADKKRTVYHNPKRAYGNIEHQRSGLDWNLDNWIYVTTDPVRFKYHQGTLIVDTLASGSNGQWGLTHDDYGRLYFSRAASGMAATGFQINPAYGQLDLEGAWDEKFQQTWPLIKTPDVNGGPQTLRQDSTMFGFTSVTGQSVFRGDRLPESFYGNYVVAEPVGRFIRRAYLSDDDGLISLTNVYEQDEFISSTDMNFRPVNTYTGPDGCLYIVDMYRGVIQESTWAQPGSFLFDQIVSKGLDKNVKRGRIYRLVYDGMNRGEKPNLLDASVTQLVSYLNHPNGWWRDNSQKELIVRADQSVVPVLKEKATSGAGAIERLHALWTLEGLNALDKATILDALDDRDVQLLKSAIRLSESLAKQSDKEVLEKLQRLSSHSSRDVRSQLLLSLSQSEGNKSIVRNILKETPDDPLLVGIQSSLQKTEEARRYGYRLSSLEPQVRQSIIAGANIFRSTCVSCHGPEGQGLPTAVAPPLISKFKLIEYKDEVIKIMLHGLKGPVDGRSYTDQMVPMGTNSDEWIASVLSYVRYDLSMRSFPQMGQGYINWVIVTPAQVQSVRELNHGREVPWTWEEMLEARKRAQ